LVSWVVAPPGFRIKGGVWTTVAIINSRSNLLRSNFTCFKNNYNYVVCSWVKSLKSTYHEAFTYQYCVLEVWQAAWVVFKVLISVPEKKKEIRKISEHICWFVSENFQLFRFLLFLKKIVIIYIFKIILKIKAKNFQLLRFLFFLNFFV